MRRLEDGKIRSSEDEKSGVGSLALVTRHAEPCGGVFVQWKQDSDHIGRFLLAASLDELPELWNVLNGDMSIVQYLKHYTPEQARRHEVKPGITGWAQVNGRNAISWEEKFTLDVW